MIWFYLAGLTMAGTAILHSWAGEKRLIAPILAIDHPVTRRTLARKVTRFAWHFTTVLMLLSAAAVVWPGMPRGFIGITGMAWLAVGLFDGVYTRGKHIGWLPLSLAGLFALLGVYL